MKSEFQVNDDTITNIKDIAVTMQSNGDSILVWNNEIEAEDSWDIFARKFDKSGNLGNRFKVNQTTNSTSNNLAITALNDDRFVIAWDVDKNNDQC